MNSLTKSVLTGALIFSATMELTKAIDYRNNNQTVFSERVIYSALAGGMAMVIPSLLNYKTEERREEHYRKL